MKKCIDTIIFYKGNLFIMKNENLEEKIDNQGNMKKNERWANEMNDVENEYN